MKRFFVFTLTALFVTTCLFLTSLSAERDWKARVGKGMMDFVWGYSEVETSFNFPIAKSYHNIAVYNDSGLPGYRAAIPVRYYYDLESEVLGPDEKERKKGDSDHGDVAARSSWGLTKTYTHNMRGAPAGDYTIEASSDLTVKVDLNGDGNPETSDGWDTSTSTEFDIE